MKNCPKCGAPVNDTAKFCPVCGGACAAPEQPQQNTQEFAQQEQPKQQSQQQYQQASQQQTYQQPQYQAPQPSYDPYDHTAEFTTKDISENKVIARLCYLMGTFGVVLALLGSHNSPYAAFHVRQALKFRVMNILLGIVALLLCFTVIVPILCGILALVLLIVRIICFFSICNGKAKEPPIIRSFGFLR